MKHEQILRMALAVSLTEQGVNIWMEYLNAGRLVKFSNNHFRLVHMLSFARYHAGGVGFTKAEKYRLTCAMKHYGI